MTSTVTVPLSVTSFAVSAKGGAWTTFELTPVSCTEPPYDSFENLWRSVNETLYTTSRSGAAVLEGAVPDADADADDVPPASASAVTSAMNMTSLPDLFLTDPWCRSRAGNVECA